VKLDGQWIPRSAYVQSQAARFAGLIKEDIENAKPPGSHDLNYDPKYQELLVLAEDSAAAKALAEQLKARNEQLARAERRRQIAQKLADPQLPLAACLKLAEELNQLKPDEDPAAQEVAERWSAARKKGAELADAAAPIAEAMEKALAQADPARPPAFDSETVVAATALAGKLDSWKQSQPPPQCLELAARAAAVSALSEISSRLAGLIEGRQFLDLQQLLETRSAIAAETGPNTR
ncbi:MAG: hypothetical protein N2322_08325, partial [Terrimicrobiaceae bacterium]|nr:hypothetical protein [Terrimicrobiaceae bacterium]